MPNNSIIQAFRIATQIRRSRESWRRQDMYIWQSILPPLTKQSRSNCYLTEQS